MILSFCYLNFKKFKDRLYSKSQALVESSGKSVGVLGSWYSYDKGGVLTSHVFDKGFQHKFVSIKHYIGTICQPFYDAKVLKVPIDLVVKLNELKEQIE